MEPKALPILIKDYCALPGEDFKAFKEEYAKLDDNDRAWFRTEFEKMGIPVKG